MVTGICFRLVVACLKFLTCDLARVTSVCWVCAGLEVSCWLTLVRQVIRVWPCQGVRVELFHSGAVGPWAEFLVARPADATEERLALDITKTASLCDEVRSTQSERVFFVSGSSSSKSISSSS